MRYFPTKEAIASLEIERVWAWFTDSVEKTFKTEPDPFRRLLILVERYLSELILDRNLCAILLITPSLVKDVPEKLEWLSNILALNLGAAGRGMNKHELRAWVMTLFYGSLQAAITVSDNPCGLRPKDILMNIKVALASLMGREVGLATY
jgi:AcrR family transcriptional regulator